MKTPFVVMERSAMSIKQKLNILANDIIRRDGCEWSAGLDEKTTEEGGQPSELLQKCSQHTEHEDKEEAH